MSGAYGKTAIGTSVVVALIAIVSILLLVGPWSASATHVADHWNAQLAIIGDIEGAPSREDPTWTSASTPTLPPASTPPPLDEPFLASPDQELKFFFRYLENPPAGQKLVKSKIGPTDTLEWPLRIEVSLASEVPVDTNVLVTVTPTLTEVPPGSSVILTRADSTQFDLTGGPVQFTMTVLADDDRVRESTTITVGVAAAPITAVIDPPGTGDEGEDIVFDGSASTPGEGASITSFQWTFGDGGAAAIATPTHTYANEGTYTVSLTVTDSGGGSDTAQHTIEISNVAPTIDLVIPNPGEIPEGGFSSISILASDPGSADVLGYSVDCDGNGQFNDPGDADDQPESSHPCTFLDDSVHNVFVQVEDDASPPGIALVLQRRIVG